MKKIVTFPLIAALSLSLCSCSDQPAAEAQKKCMSLWGTTWYEDGVFYEKENANGDMVLCYYSKAEDRSDIICDEPDCPHSSKDFHHCGALKSDNVHERNGFNSIGDKLYYFESTIAGQDTLGTLDLIESDMGGKNKRIVASIEDTSFPFIQNVTYTDDGNVIISYYQNFGFEDNITGGLEYVEYEKYKFFIKRINISTGETETLVQREEYSGYGGGIVKDNILYYNYAYKTEPPTGEVLTEATAKPSVGGLYILDLSTGEEKLYEKISVFNNTFDYLDPENMMVYMSDKKKLGILNAGTGEIKEIADYHLGGYTADDRDAVFMEENDSEYWTRYNFETGELTQIPAYKGKLGVFLNGVYMLGETVWLQVSPERDSSHLRNAYMDREDFLNGNYENITLIKEAELQ